MTQQRSFVALVVFTLVSASLYGQTQDSSRSKATETKTYGNAIDGCLTDGETPGIFILVFDSNKKVKVRGGADLGEHVDHRVRIEGGVSREDDQIYESRKVIQLSSKCRPETSGTSRSQADPPRSTSTRATTVSEGQGDGVTADQQGMTPADRKTTQSIRQAVVSDKSLSIYAHNVKIITRDGVVTLKGPVRDSRERSVIGQKAAAVAGAEKVINELIIEAK